jgi:hypothetical protein
MYQLSEKAVRFIRENAKERMSIASHMGVTEQSILKGLNRNSGRNIAKSYEGFNKLIDLSGMPTKDLRVIISEKVK